VPAQPVSRVACKEVPVNWNTWFRQSHRWLSIAFTLVVLINGIAIVARKYNNKLGLAAVAVLALLFLTGAYLFVLPYVSRWRQRATRL
jgi:heme A synthase